MPSSAGMIPLRPVWLVLAVCRHAGHPANVINRLLTFQRQQSVDHELIAAPLRAHIGSAAPATQSVHKRAGTAA
jgi:hypothetical protein